MSRKMQDLRAFVEDLPAEVVRDKDTGQFRSRQYGRGFSFACRMILEEIDRMEANNKKGNS